MNSRRFYILIGIQAFIVVLALIIILTQNIRFNNNSGSNTSSAMVSSSSSSSVQTSVGGLYSAEIIEISETAPRITIEYPQISDATNFNKAVKEDMDEIVDAYTGPEIDVSPVMENSLAMNFEVKYFNNGIISVRMEGSVYTGGAHPNSIFYTITYDLINDRRLELADLFGSDILTTLQDFSRIELASRDISDTESIAFGTEATSLNYQYWYLTEDDLNIIFPPYQVAAYAAGAQEVELLESELSVQESYATRIF